MTFASMAAYVPVAVAQVATREKISCLLDAGILAFMEYFTSVN